MAELTNQVEVIDVKPRHLKLVQDFLAQMFPGKEIWAYGSRVNGNSHERSDLDCVVFGTSDRQMAIARDAFHDTAIPFELSLLSWEGIPDDFKTNIGARYFVLQK
jgi:uncharacterized protein